MSEKIYDDGTTAVYIAPIADADGTDRRSRERAAVAGIVSEIFGPETSLQHTPDGAPYIDGANYHISISHSRLWAAVAVSRGPVGIDVEEPRQQLCRVAPRVLSDSELKLYENRLLEAWTLKEALYKCAGIPGVDFRRDISLPANESYGAATATSCTETDVPSELVGASCTVAGATFRILTMMPYGGNLVALVAAE